MSTATFDHTRTTARLPPVYVAGTARLLAGESGQPPSRDRGWLVEASRSVALLGRGGAAFPVSAKLAAVGRGAEILVNGSEGEPASWKDRVLMRTRPGLVLDGALVVAGALSSRRVTLAVADEVSAAALQEAIRERGAADRVSVVAADHGFVGGEVQALVNGLNGRAAVPNGRRVLPSDRGVGGRPTFASNVETFAQLALLAALGPERYARVGTTSEPGTTLVTVHRPDRGTSVVEVPHGTPLSDLIDGVGPVLVGGYHGTWTSAGGLTVDRPALRAAGIGWGAGVVATLPQTTCPVGEIARVAQWLAAESAGQCGPCVFGLASIAEDLVALVSGQRVDTGRLRRRLGLVAGRGACSHPDGTVRFVATALDAYADDLARHEHGVGCGRPVLGTLPLGGTR
ncbi:NADH-ubiquinone oxidoreductase-F iron-sulfur binding region domain-containing protein [Nocardioides sp. BP30]|uniref:NADH-ubiquinone oxidoreductase-F iron-sulfur binding region domain-containing protein n=1 Tax=Nocardioides sp. BP30 TaxID=3036374 RepID=UPI002468D1B2|nr:NADH-ubiquinone oxidoreductase-F iron-sulfur binding region domain-containing protein [Nocardioides sp. BP30]WGL51067.1 NADH-ubiquinone oxidoreductase-F iron-sulfur binding region domain-containing protein [Nocardioides sp. BP30]